MQTFRSQEVTWESRCSSNLYQKKKKINLFSVVFLSSLQMLRCVSSRPRVLVLRRPCMPAVRRAPPRRGWATHKDLPDPPKKPAPETAQRRLDLENSRFDGAELKKLADSITPREVREKIPYHQQQQQANIYLMDLPHFKMFTMNPFFF